jgi:hypothetical protein
MINVTLIILWQFLGAWSSKGLLYDVLLSRVIIIYDFIFQRRLRLWLWCLTPLSIIFQLYRGGQFYWWRKPEYPEKTTDLPDLMVVGFITTYMQSVPIIMLMLWAHDEVYLIQHYVIKFVSYLRKVSGFLRILWFPPSIKLTATI